MQKVLAWFVFGSIVGGVVTFLFLLFTLRSGHPRDGQEQRVPQYELTERRTIADRIVYLKDTRTNLCYAYYWDGSSYSGPAISCVPCEKVENLIVKPEE